MKTLLFTGRVVSEDKEPLFCCEEIEVAAKEVSFKSYPLSLLKTVIDDDGVTVDGIRYEWQTLPIAIYKSGKHVTVYRDTVEESITITIEFKSNNTEGKV